MQCQCGNTMSESTHEIKTLAKAREWASDATNDDLPLKIHQNKCSACGRLNHKAESNKNVIINKFN